jgi:GNAT superfamily N-acetyltransferase
MGQKAENRMANDSMAPSPDLISFREASVSDVQLMEQSRSLHGSGRADERMSAYFRGLHYPQNALLPRTGYIAMADNKPVGYTAGHLTTRFGYTGELQYLFVALPYRRRGIGRRLVKSLASWFVAQDALRVCVCVDLESEPAAPFYASLGASPFRPSWYAWEDIAAVFSQHGSETRTMPSRKIQE